MWNACTNTSHTYFIPLPDCRGLNAPLQAADTNFQSTDSVVVAVLGCGYNTLTYKGSMDVFRKHFSGLYFFKQMPDDKKRMVVLSEFGLNLLDFQFTNDSAQLMNAQEFLNKPGLIELMKGDFGFLVNGIKTSEVLKSRHQTPKKGVERTRIKTEKGQFTLYHRVTDQRLVRVKRRQGWFSSVKYSFTYGNSDLPEEIMIRHTGLPFKMKLKKIKEE